MLSGTVVAASGGVVQVSGGAGGDGNGTAGGGGHYLFGTNVAGGSPIVPTGASATLSFAGATQTNPYVNAIHPSTPYIPNLADSAAATGLSAAVYGLGDNTLTQANIAASLPGGNLPAVDVNGNSITGAIEALVRVHTVAAGNYNTQAGVALNFTGYDFLVAINLATGAITNPMLGVDGASPLALQQLGYTRDTSVGGVGGPVSTNLALNQAWTTLIPSGNAGISTILGNGFSNTTLVGLTLGTGNASNQVLYLIPEPSTFVLIGLGSVFALSVSRRRRRSA